MIEPQGSVAEWARRGVNVRVGFDIASVADVSHSLRTFGSAYERRVFTPHELEYASRSPLLRDERLAVRFAAKEAVIKALDISDEAFAWNDIEVVKRAGGGCCLVLHGAVGRAARRQGIAQVLLSLSHEGDSAAAFVVALPANAEYASTLNNATFDNGPVPTQQ